MVLKLSLVAGEAWARQRSDPMPILGKFTVAAGTRGSSTATEITPAPKAKTTTASGDGRSSNTPPNCF